MLHDPLRNAFSGDFSSVRKRFIDAARRIGAELFEYRHPLAGPDGEALATDVARIGAADARKLIILVSGTHGVEGHFGSACQIKWMTEDLVDRLHGDTAVLFVHLINPWGNAWRRRVNEDNVDLNRNFVDWQKPRPANPGYKALHPIYACPQREGPLRESADALLAEAMERLGSIGFHAIVGAGQYDYPDGLFFGGNEPTWSNRTLNSILERFALGAEQVVAFDLHTGAGPYAYPALLAVSETDHPDLEWGRAVFGPALSVVVTGVDATTETGIAATATGYVSDAIRKKIPDTKVVPLVIECGTLDRESVNDAVHADHWLHQFGDLDSEEARRIKSDIFGAFIPDDGDWRDAVVRQSLRYFDRALHALQQGSAARRGQAARKPAIGRSAEAAGNCRAKHDGHPPAVLVEDLHKQFGALSVLNGVGIEAQVGDVVSMIGASGSGKSTFLRCINFLERPSRGRIAIDGEEIAMKTASDGHVVPRDMRQVERLRARVGMVFQSFNLWPHMTVLENLIEAPMHVLKTPRGEATDYARELLEKVGLSDKADQYPARMSGGQQQRAAIARTLAMRPKVMLFDEPTSALDPELVGEVLRVIRQLAEEGNTMILVTHEMQFAREVSNKTIFLHEGRIEEEGATAALFADPKSPRLRQFLARTF